MEFRPENVPKELEDLLPDFLENSFADYHDLMKSYKEDDVEGMRAVCHRVLGTAVSYGFEQMDEVFTSLQNTLQEKGIAEACSDVELIKRYFAFIEKHYQYKASV